MTSHKIQFYTSKSQLDNLVAKRIIEEGGKLFEMLFNMIPYVDQSNPEAKEAVTTIQFYLSDHNELKEAIDLW